VKLLKICLKMIIWSLRCKNQGWHLCSVNRNVILWSLPKFKIPVTQHGDLVSCAYNIWILLNPGHWYWFQAVFMSCHSWVIPSMIDWAHCWLPDRPRTNFHGTVAER
jgi:hypothetical protein